VSIGQVEDGGISIGPASGGGSTDTGADHQQTATTGVQAPSASQSAPTAPATIQEQSSSSSDSVPTAAEQQKPGVSNAPPPPSSGVPGAAPVTGTPVGQKVCDKYGSTKPPGGKVMVQNDEWGASDGQCVTANTAGGFTVNTGQHHKDSAPAAFPSAMSGCWQGTCTTGTTLPTQISKLGPISSSMAGTIPPGAKSNLAYDIWADSTPKKTGQNDAMELMIWLKETGGIKPIGQKTGTVQLAGVTWDVYKGSNGVPVISYVRQPYVDSADNLPITDFVKDAVKQGSVKPTDYLTNIQAGFEPWTGGPGLTLSSFSVNYGNTAGAPTSTAAAATGGVSAGAVVLLPLLGVYVRRRRRGHHLTSTLGARR
jgi:hypothetical protein